MKKGSILKLILNWGFKNDLLPSISKYDKIADTILMDKNNERNAYQIVSHK